MIITKTICTEKDIKIKDNVQTERNIYKTHIR